MNSARRGLLLPAVVFVAVLAAHYFWFAADGSHTRWVSLDDEPSYSPLRVYGESGTIWLGLSYALALGFAVASLERYREQRFCTARTLSIGGVTLSGFLAVAGCYVLGCCGSPVLAVYLSLFGVTFLPFTKPLVFVFTVTSLAAAWWWASRRERAVTTPPASNICDCQ